MKAAVYERYGPPDVVQIQEVPKPTPKPNDVLIRVVATTVTIGDTIMRSFNLPISGWQKLFARLYLGIRKPRRTVLGMELAGEIEAVGDAVTRFTPGDQVFASTFAVNFGGHAEYKCIPAGGMLALKPDNVSFEEAAAAVGGGMTALHCLRKANIQSGQRVVIYGASGAVGTNAVQLAAFHFGAEVTGVCSGANVDMVRGLGAAEVVDYTQEDFTQRGVQYDVIFDAVGKLDAAHGKSALKPGGVYLNVHRASDGAERQEALEYIRSALEVGTLRTVIDRRYPLAEIVEAHRYVEQGHKKGNVAIMVAPPG